MFRTTSISEYDERAEGGIRPLFALGPYDFHDAMDAEGEFHHFVVEPGESEEDEPLVYEVDLASMYELMARFLAGEYEKAEYGMERSPAHDALLDLLELATARARSGDSGFTLDALEDVEYEDEEYEDEELEEDPGEERR